MQSLKRHNLTANQIRVRQIDKRLAEIDAEAIRPLRAIQAGMAQQFDHDKLENLDAEAATLRSERAGLV